MVFKVKKRVAVDFEKTRRGLETSNTASMPTYIQEKYSYNWPYDYCSLVELAQIEETVQWASRDVKSPEPIEITYTPRPTGMTAIQAAPMPPFLRGPVENIRPVIKLPPDPPQAKTPQKRTAGRIPTKGKAPSKRRNTKKTKKR